jgi:flagellar motor switch protein FliG
VKAAEAAEKGGIKQELTGRQKAAIFLVTLGSEISAEIFKHLREEEIEALTFEIARLDAVEPEQRDMVLMEFRELMMAQDFITTGGYRLRPGTLGEILGFSKGRRHHQPPDFLSSDPAL